MEARVVRQREENAELRGECERLSLDAAVIKAKMLAAKEDTDEAAKALKELIVGLGSLAPKAGPRFVALKCLKRSPKQRPC